MSSGSRVREILLLEFKVSDGLWGANYNCLGLKLV